MKHVNFFPIWEQNRGDEFYVHFNEARVDLVVTGDRHLLKLRKFEGIPIVRLGGFLRLFPDDVLA
jgi:predicted nucleic acid-binding protein